MIRMSLTITNQKLTDIKGIKMSTYSILAATNVNDHKQKKGQFDYLSWTWAIDAVQRTGLDFSYELLDDVIYADGTMEVRCIVKLDGLGHTMWLAVSDHKNKAIVNPDAAAVNKARMRCLVKGIAIHGLGFYIYAGEDLPEANDYLQAQAMVEAGDFMAFKEWLTEIGEERHIAVYNDAPAGEKVAWKKRFTEEVKKADDKFQAYVSEVKSAIGKADAYALAQTFDEIAEISQAFKKRVWGVLTEDDQKTARELKEVTG